MTAIDFYQPRFSLKSSFNCVIILLAQIFYIRSLTISVLSFFVLSSSFFARLSMCYRQEIKLRSQKMAAANDIAFIIQKGVWSMSSSCHGLFAFTANRQRHSTKLRLNFA